MKRHIYITKEFSTTADANRWLNSFKKPFDIVGYSAYGVGDVRNHQEFMPGVFITIRIED